jgi:hypothetical protein
MSYQDKYLKYKKKYLELKEIIGGNGELIRQCRDGCKHVTGHDQSKSCLAPCTRLSKCIKDCRHSENKQCNANCVRSYRQSETDRNRNRSSSRSQSPSYPQRMLGSRPTQGMSPPQGMPRPAQRPMSPPPQRMARPPQGMPRPAQRPMSPPQRMARPPQGMPRPAQRPMSPPQEMPRPPPPQGMPRPPPPPQGMPRHLTHRPTLPLQGMPRHLTHRPTLPPREMPRPPLPPPQGMPVSPPQKPTLDYIDKLTEITKMFDISNLALLNNYNIYKKAEEIKKSLCNPMGVTLDHNDQNPYCAKTNQILSNYELGIEFLNADNCEENIVDKEYCQNIKKELDYIDSLNK